MPREVKVNVISAWDDLPEPNDWLLKSVFPIQLEACIIRAGLAHNDPEIGEELVKLAPPDFSPRESDYVDRMTEAFLKVEQNFRFYICILVSPVVHLPNYGSFHNRAVTAHFWLRERYNPRNFLDKLRVAMTRFLCCPDSLVFPPRNVVYPAAGQMLPEGHVPLRLFIINVDDSCCPENKPTLCDRTLRGIHRLFLHLPTFHDAYTASVYVLSKPSIDVINAKCIGYGKRVVPKLKAS